MLNSDQAHNIQLESVLEYWCGANLGQDVQYAETIKSIRQQAEEEVEIAKRRDGLEDLTVDLTSIKPSFSW